MRIVSVIAALVFGAATAQAGEPMTEGQEIQALQSALTILGYDPGKIDGRPGPRTDAAIAAFTDASGFVADDDDPQRALINAVLDATGPALIDAFGTDPTGSWDIDLAASGIDASASDGALCESQWAIYFSGGIVWRHWDSGSPIVMALVDDRLEAQSLPSGEFIEPFAFEFVDADTMHRSVEGETEVWVRCDES